MSDIAVTATRVATLYPILAEVFTFIAGETILAGQAVCLADTGKAMLAGDSGTLLQFKGIALESVGAGQAVSVLKRGWLHGFTISGLAFDALVYLSATSGALATTGSVLVGRVMSIPEVGGIVKALYIHADWVKTQV